MALSEMPEACERLPVQGQMTREQAFARAFFHVWVSSSLSFGTRYSAVWAGDAMGRLLAMAGL